MTRLFIALALLISLAAPLHAADLVPLDYTFPVMGAFVDNAFKATLDNTAKSIKTLAETAGITWLQNGRPPQGALIAIETYDARFGTANITTANGIGIIWADGVNGHIAGADALANTYFTTKTQGSNAVIQIILER
jgi:hypothetical protein